MNIRAFIARHLPAQPCLLCAAMSHDGLCCAACRAALPHLGAATCPLCARPVPGGAVCGQCLQHPPAFDRTIAAFAYRFPLDQLVKALKFHEQLIVADFLADALAARIDTRPDGLIAMPLHPLRLRNRGFNQSQLLAARVAQRLELPLLSGWVERVRDTPPQSSLPWAARHRNLRGAFAVTRPAEVRGKHLAIVDDVMTSGASLNALATALKQAGAREVSAWVVARTLSPTEQNPGPL
ncbi:ComF family protein [Ferrigenium sp. UT4]